MSTPAERITIAVVHTNGSPDEITAAILAAIEPEMAVVKAAVSVERQAYQTESWHKAYYLMEEAVLALPPEWRERGS
jgi:hypothetical protein